MSTLVDATFTARRLIHHAKNQTNLFATTPISNICLKSGLRRKYPVSHVRTVFTPTSTMSASEATGSRKTKKRKPKHFAPLNPDAKHGHDLPKLKGIIFDVDGTLCLPQNYMFKEMRAALDIPKRVDILDHVRSLSNEQDGADPDTSPSEHETSKARPQSTTDEPQAPSTDLLSPSLSTQDLQPPSSSPQSRAVAKIQAIERRAMTSQQPQPGLQALMSYLHRRNIPKALCTRNFPAPVHHLLDSFLLGEEFGTFDTIITRDSEGVAPKPSPEGIWRIAEHWGLDQSISEAAESLDGVDGGEIHEDLALELAKRHLGSGLMMVGDSIDDMAAGYRAGAATVLLVNDENATLAGYECTGRSIRRLDELIGILEEGFREEEWTDRIDGR